MKIVKASNGKTRITLSKKEWKEIGRTAGWITPDDGYADGGQPYTDGELDFYNGIESPDGPDSEDDCFITTNGGLYLVSCGGKLIKSVVEFNDAIKIVRNWQDRNEYYPNIWMVSDHGNEVLIDRKGNQIK
jgi:hypothetical protein